MCASLLPVKRFVVGRIGNKKEVWKSEEWRMRMEPGRMGKRKCAWWEGKINWRTSISG